MQAVHKKELLKDVYVKNGVLAETIFLNKQIILRAFFAMKLNFDL